MNLHDIWCEQMLKVSHARGLNANDISVYRLPVFHPLATLTGAVLPASGNKISQSLFRLCDSMLFFFLSRPAMTTCDRIAGCHPDAFLLCVVHSNERHRSCMSAFLGARRKLCKRIPACKPNNSLEVFRLKSAAADVLTSGNNLYAVFSMEVLGNHMTSNETHK